ncbi:hypothetical protein NKH93_30215 [Mesorhizobium sp. M0954]|uniref:hypothetical protein n=1 Tax=Mesorhizobium sp. M0954 TaxID=2957032 RepID=UPI00333AC303
MDVSLREQDGVIADEVVLRVLVSDLQNVPPGIPTDISGIPITIVQRDPQIEADLARYPVVVGGISVGRLTSLLVSSSGTMGGIARENNTGQLRGIKQRACAGIGCRDGCLPAGIFKPAAVFR